MDEEITFTTAEIAERREFITEQIKRACQENNNYFRYKDLADALEYAGISRKETFDTIHQLERIGVIVRRKKNQ